MLKGLERQELSHFLIQFMDSWTYQTGFPLIRLSPLNATAVVAKQEQFFYLQPPMPNPSTWKVGNKAVNIIVVVLSKGVIHIQHEH
jgi:hypothetical protein